jgi:hypothetical protein
MRSYLTFWEFTRTSKLYKPLKAFESLSKNSKALVDLIRISAALETLEGLI